MTVALTPATLSTLIPDFVSRYGRAVIVNPMTRPNGSKVAPTSQGAGMDASSGVPDTAIITDNS
jgi:hypothetical protein